MIPTTITDGFGRVGHSRVGAAIQRAAARTGVDFDYLMNQARVESGLNPDARARTSSATGLFQFLDQTWLSTVHKHGDSHGLGWAAEAIRRGPNGRYYVADPGMRRAVLDLRRQPEAASAMAAEFASDNRAFLERRIGRQAAPVDLYLAHFLGAGGAAQFLRHHDANPNASAAAVLPAAARSNRAVFYERDGSPRSFAEIRQRFASRFGDEAESPLPLPMGAPPEELSVRMAALGGEDEPSARPGFRDDLFVRPSPQRARLAYLMLATLDAE